MVVVLLVVVVSAHRSSPLGPGRPGRGELIFACSVEVAHPWEVRTVGCVLPT